MRSMMANAVTVTLWALIGSHGLIGVGKAQNPAAATSAQIPQTWDHQDVAALEIPLANPAYSPVHVTSDYYYRMPVRPIYKSYPIYAPVYAPGKGPAGYLDWLKQQEPEIVFDAAKLKTESDWIRAGELVFDAPISASKPAQEFYDKTSMPVAKDGTIPFQRMVSRTVRTQWLGGNAGRLV